MHVRGVISFIDGSKSHDTSVVHRDRSRFSFVLLSLQRATKRNEVSVYDFMSVDPITARLDEVVNEIAHRMATERVHRVVVIDDDERVVGVVTTLDLLKVFPD